VGVGAGWLLKYETWFVRYIKEDWEDRLRTLEMHIRYCDNRTGGILHKTKKTIETIQIFYDE
jgi:hypothetical protein